MSTWSPTRENAAERKENLAREAFVLGEDIKWLMSSREGRRIAWRLISGSKVLQGSLSNNTATVQSAIVAVRDFVMENLLQHVLAVCPNRFLEMKAEAEHD